MTWAQDISGRAPEAFWKIHKTAVPERACQRVNAHRSLGLACLWMWIFVMIFLNFYDELTAHKSTPWNCLELLFKASGGEKKKNVPGAKPLNPKLLQLQLCKHKYKYAAVKAAARC